MSETRELTQAAELAGRAAMAIEEAEFCEARAMHLRREAERALSKAQKLVAEESYDRG